MTDKQIIIDGEQCEYLSDIGLCRLTYYFTGKSYDCSMCKDNPNCHYKNWQRKEQECEELKVNSEEQSYRYAELDADYICLQDKVGKLERAILRRNDELDQLKAENEELKEQLELNTANAVVIDMAQRLHNYKQAIEKIKQLLQKEINDCEYRDDCASCEYNCCIRQAMQICNEVISE